MADNARWNDDADEDRDDLIPQDRRPVAANRLAQSFVKVIMADNAQWNDDADEDRDDLIPQDRRPVAANRLAQSIVISDSDENGDDFSEDNFEVREQALHHFAKVKGSIGPAQNDARVGINLDDEANVKELEDPGLLKHMSEARIRLIEHTRAQESLRPIKELIGEDVTTRRALSEMSNKMNEQQMHLQCCYEELLAIMDTVSPEIKKKIKSITDTMGSSLGELKAVDHLLIVTRRNYESVVDGMKKYTELLAEGCDHNRPAKTTPSQNCTPGAAQ